MFDEAHSDDEDRFISIGPGANGVLLVVFTEPDEDTTRIISARLATKNEVRMYRTYVGGEAS
jgi:uncharacterized DUF497 family protein